MPPTQPGGPTVWCLEPHDLCASKLVAGRPKDIRYVEAAVRLRIVDSAELRLRVAICSGHTAAIERALGYVDRFAPGGLPAAERAGFWKRRADALRDIEAKRMALDPESRRPAVQSER